MFRLLSKEIKIFSIPLYVIFLFLMVVVFNALDFRLFNVFSGVFSFAGIALGYFTFNSIGLNHRTHLPLFIYTFLVFAFYNGDLDIGISVNLFTNAFILLILSTRDQVTKKDHYLIVGSLLAIGYLFLPTTWAVIFFVLMHLSVTSDRIGLNIFRLFFGFILIILSYLGVMYLIGNDSFNPEYVPFVSMGFQTDFYPLYFISPVAVLLILAIANHFMTFQQKSPTTRFRYTFVLLYTITQIFIVIMYMGKTYEYLLFLVLPVSIIVSRALNLMPKYWMKELGLWIIIVSLILFKISPLLNTRYLLNI